MKKTSACVRRFAVPRVVHHFMFFIIVVFSRTRAHAHIRSRLVYLHRFIATAFSALLIGCNASSVGAQNLTLQIPQCAQRYVADDDDWNEVTFAMVDLRSEAKERNKKGDWRVVIYKLDETCPWRDWATVSYEVHNQLKPQNFRTTRLREESGSNEYTMHWERGNGWRGKSVVSVKHLKLGTPARIYLIVMTPKKE